MAAQGDHQLAFSALVIDGQAAAHHHHQQQLQQNPEKLPKQSGEPITARAKLREAAGTGADIEAGASQLWLLQFSFSRTQAHTPFSCWEGRVQRNVIIAAPCRCSAGSRERREGSEGEACGFKRGGRRAGWLAGWPWPGWGCLGLPAWGCVCGGVEIREGVVGTGGTGTACWGGSSRVPGPGPACCALPASIHPSAAAASHAM